MVLSEVKLGQLYNIPGWFLQNLGKLPVSLDRKPLRTDGS